MQGKRNFSLDILRGAAITLVLFRHMPLPVSPAMPFRAGYYLWSISWTGVDLFFVLSGFLISGLLYNEIDKTGSLRLRRFWMRRGLKIWPSYYFIFAITTPMAAYLVAKTQGRKVAWHFVVQQMPSLIFIQNYLPVEYRWGASWSVAIEEHFYLSLPIILLLLYRKGRLQWLLPMGGLFCVAILAWRIFAYSRGADWIHLYFPTHLREDTLCFGVMLGYIHRYKPQVAQRICRFWPILILFAAAIIVSVAVLPLAGESAFAPTIGFTLLYLAFGGLVLLAGTNPNFGEHGRLSLLFKALAFLGVYSYTIYLVHAFAWIVPAMLNRSTTLIPNRTYMNSLFLFLVSIAGGYLASKLVEQPLLRLREKRFPSETPQTTVPPSSGSDTPKAQSRANGQLKNGIFQTFLQRRKSPFKDLGGLGSVLRTWLPGLPWVICVSLFLFNFSLIRKYAVNLPHWDEWGLIYGDNHPASIDFPWLYQQVNDHRTATTKLFVWLQYHLNGLNLRTRQVLDFLIY